MPKYQTPTGQPASVVLRLAERSEFAGAADVALDLADGLESVVDGELTVYVPIAVVAHIQATIAACNALLLTYIDPTAAAAAGLTMGATAKVVA